MERWTFLVIAGPDGQATHLRVFLRVGDDPASWPAAQIALDGSAVPVDDAPHDYEAPEWKAVQLLDTGMGGGADGRMTQVKDALRARVVV